MRCLGVVLVIFGMLGFVATAWLGSYLSMQWLAACWMQALIFVLIAAAGVYFYFEVPQ